MSVRDGCGFRKTAGESGDGNCVILAGRHLEMRQSSCCGTNSTSTSLRRAAFSARSTNSWKARSP